MLEIPTGRRQTSWVFYKHGRGELGSSMKQLQLVVRAELELRTFGFQVPLPPAQAKITNLHLISRIGIFNRMHLNDVLL